MNEGGFSVRVKEDEKELCAWQTDTFEIDYYDSDHNQQHPHTILMFVPGNPGCAGWYIAMLKTVVERLGRGYACRAASYAGHGTVSHLVTAKDDKGKKLAWSVDGQVEHKIEWIDLVTRECMSIGTEERQESARALPRFIFISHSIGAHLVQRLCVLREDILLRTDAIIHFMPFTRFDPMPMWKETFLSTLANIPGLIIPTFQMGSRFASKMPQRFVDGFLEHIAGMSLLEDRELARELFTNDEYVENHLQLGLEEIRHIPENHDTAALRMIGRICPTFMFYGGNPDQWAPQFHMQDMKNDIASGDLPSNISFEYNDDLLHDFIVHPEMIEPATDFILKSIKGPTTRTRGGQHTLKSKL